jgi:hypothetical protein
METSRKLHHRFFPSFSKTAEQKRNFCVSRKKVINVVICLHRRPLSCSISRNNKSIYLSRLCSPDVWDAHEGKLLEVGQQLLPLLWRSRHHLRRSAHRHPFPLLRQSLKRNMGVAGPYTAKENLIYIILL